MISKTSRNKLRLKRKLRIKYRVRGSTERPRLCVYKSLKHIYAQIIDDDKGITLCSASTLDPEIRDRVKGCNVESAKLVGELISKRAREKGIESIVFDRNGYIYHGKVKALADSAREGGLRF